MYFSEKEKENHQTLQKWLSMWHKPFSLDEAEISWHKNRRFFYKKIYTNLLDYDEYSGHYHKSFYLFSPLPENNIHYKTMLDSGFYSRYFDFQLNWSENNF
jgi:hypothetical protein